MRYHSLLSLGYLWASLDYCAASSRPSGLAWKAGWIPSSTVLTDGLAEVGLLKLAAVKRAQGAQSNCTFDNADLRREWSTLLPDDRKAYTSAVNCLTTLPSRILQTNASLAPGAKTRFDDFTAVHMNQTLQIHATANFLTWHRLFIWTFERSLRDECGFQGTLPYWNWARTAQDPINSPVFDGSDFSMSGNGAFEEHNCTNAINSNSTPPLNCIPPGEGGGCITSGPFQNHTVNLAPAFPGLAEKELNASLPFMSFSPRCLKRDVSPWVSQNFTKDSDVAELIAQNPDIYWFQTIMQGNGFKDGFFGVHVGGHYTIGGDPGGDFFASPGDPIFYLHHGQIDRTYVIWQNQDLPNRQNAISGTLTINDTPPSRNGTLDDILDMGILGTSMPQHMAMDTMGGPFCYVYV